MMRFAAVCLLLMAGACQAAITVAVEQPALYGFASITLRDVAPNASVSWEFTPDPVQQRETSTTGGTVMCVAASPGAVIKLRLQVISYDKMADKIVNDVKTYTLTFPGIPAPVPVDPPKPPTPPGPQPTNELRVLFVLERTDVPLTREQQNVIYSTKITDYLNRKCVKDPDGKPGWRRYDKDTIQTTEPDLWKQMWDKSKPFAKVPIMVVFRGMSGEKMDLPATEDATLALLKQYGGE